MALGAAILLWACLLASYPVSRSQVDIDYRCSGEWECLCATLNEETTLVQLVCSPYILDTTIYNTSWIQGHLTTWLTINCLWAYDGKLQGRDFEHLSGLTELNILNCHLPSLPENSFYNLKHVEQIRILSIGQPSMNSSLLEPLESLKSFSLVENTIQSLPDRLFCGRNNLLFLNISRNFIPRMDRLGIDFLNEDPCLPALEALIISYNYISFLQPHMNRAMPRLTYLLARGNGILSVSSIHFHDLSLLNTVDLGLNRISRISNDAFRDSPDLQYLDLGGNQLQYLPNDLFTNNTRLIYLNLTQNRLQDVDFSIIGNVEFANLQVIHIGSNYLTRLIPYDCRHFKNVQVFDVSNNQIHTLDDGTFLSMTMMESIDLSNNNLTTITNATFVGLQIITDLKLSGNNIRIFDDMALSASTLLKNIFLARNALTFIPAALKNLSYLESLDLSDNLIDVLPEGKVMWRLQSLVGLSLKRNRISKIGPSAFDWAPNLQVLNLEQNKISSLDRASFLGLNNLIYLKLDQNAIVSLSGALIPLVRLNQLFAIKNNIKTLSKEPFPTSLVLIDLSENRLSTLGAGTFLALDSLQMVNMEHNQLSYFSPEALEVSVHAPYQPQFYMGGNFIDCNCHMTWFSRIHGDNSVAPRYPLIPDFGEIGCFLNDVRLKYTVLHDVDLKSLLCEYNVDCGCECCGQPGCGCDCQEPCFACPENCTCWRTEDGDQDIIYCSGKELDSVPASLNSRATSIQLDGNNITEVHKLQFYPEPAKSSRLNTIYLNNSGIVYVAVDTFDGLESLETIYLQQNRLTCLYTGTFANLPSLRILNISSNSIHTMEPGVLGLPIQLHVFYLHDNSLSTLPSDVMSNISGLTELTLSRNPWSCECDGGPDLKVWLTKHALIVSDAKYMFCHRMKDAALLNQTDNIVDRKQDDSLFKLPHCPEPPLYRYQTKPVLQESFDFCKPNGSVIVRELQNRYTKELKFAVISIASLFLIMVMITIVTYRYRDLIKVWLFTHYGLRFREPKEDDNKRYDAFISYSSKDELFIMEKLAPKLEPTYKLLLHYRDWAVGGSVTESIIESVENSKRTILVLSDNYLESEWCHFEFRTAHHNVMKERKNRIIIILYGPELPKGMDSKLKLHTSSRTYLKHDDPQFWDKLQYALPSPKLQGNENVPELRVKDNVVIKA